MRKRVLSFLLGISLIVFGLSACVTPAEQEKSEVSSSEAVSSASSSQISSENETNEDIDNDDSFDESVIESIEEDTQVPDMEDIEIPDGQVIKLGYLAQTATLQLSILMTEAIENSAASFGDQIELYVYDANSEAAKQVSQAEDLITLGCDVIIINAVDKDQCTVAVENIVEAGIGLVCLNTRVSNVDIADSYVGVDDVESGATATQMIVDALGGDGSVYAIQGLLGHPANEYRRQGMEEVLEEYPNIVLQGMPNADWDRNKAMNVTEDIIASGNEIDACICFNDEMAIAASNVFRSAGMDDVLVVGIDAIDEVLQMIKAGDMYGSVFQSAEKQGTAAFNVALCVALDIPVEKDYFIPFEPVTIENVENYIGLN